MVGRIPTGSDRNSVKKSKKKKKSKSRSSSPPHSSHNRVLTSSGDPPVPPLSTSGPVHQPRGYSQPPPGQWCPPREFSAPSNSVAGSSQQLLVNTSGSTRIPVMGFSWPNNPADHSVNQNSSDRPPVSSSFRTPDPPIGPNRDQDSLSIHPNENDPLLRESRDIPFTATRVEKAQDPPPPPSTHASDEEEPELELPRFSFGKAVEEVFRHLPENVCPRILTPKGESFQGFLDLDDSASKIEESNCFLPMPPSVKAMSECIDSDISVKVDSNSWSSWAPPSSLLSKKLGYHPYFYKFSQEPFPTSLPPLDSDASRLGIRPPSSVSVPLKQLERWETRLRQLLGVASYNNAFTAALNSALKNPSEVDPESTKLLLDALNKSSLHSMGLSLVLAAELFKVRRESHIPSGSSLSANSRRKLRTVPLSADTMFGKTVAEVSQVEKDDRLLAPPKPRVQESKRYFPKRKGGGNPSHTPSKKAKPNPPPASKPSNQPSSSNSWSTSKSNHPQRKVTVPKPKSSFPSVPKGSKP